MVKKSVVLSGTHVRLVLFINVIVHNIHFDYIFYYLLIICSITITQDIMYNRCHACQSIRHSVDIPCEHNFSATLGQN